MTLKLTNKNRYKDAFVNKSAFEPNPLIDIEIPTLMISKTDGYKCFLCGIAIGLGLWFLVKMIFE